MIDDNPSIHEDFRKILTPPEMAGSADFERLHEDLFDEAPAAIELNFEIESAYQGEEGLALAKRAIAEDRPHALAFVDMRMPPGWDGLETIGRLWEVAPALQVVICTAFADSSWSQILRKLGRQDGLLILKKPFDTIEVVQMARALATKWLLHEQVQGKLQDLEQLVGERTEELLRMNDFLRQEIQLRKQTEGQLIEAKKLEGLGIMAAGIAHEINNPMAVVTANVALLASDLERLEVLPESLREFVAEVLPDTLDCIRRVNGIVAGVQRFARLDDGVETTFDLNDEVTAALRMVKGRVGKLQTLELTLGAVAPLRGRPSQIAQVIVNLVLNALQAAPEHGRVEVRTRQEGQEAIFEVEDDGAGMSEETRRQIFQPFFTTKDVGKGTGLGLAVSHGIVKSHLGQIEVRTQLGKGTCFSVRLPVASPNPAAKSLAA